MAEQLLADYYGCDVQRLDDAKLLTQAAHEAVHAVGAQVVEECVHRFKPMGVSYIAVISTSHISIHTWPEDGYAAVDIFSCTQGIPQEVAQALGRTLGADTIRTKMIRRDVKGGTAIEI